MSGNHAVERLVEHATGLQFNQLNAPAVSALKTFLLDSLGVGICGSRVVFTRELLKLAQGWGAGCDARVLCTGESLPAPLAAMVNGWQIHNQEFDCVHEPAVVHPMATILAALLAWADRRGNVDGRAFLTALSVAVDAATLLGTAARSPLRFFRPAVCGGLGASLAMARLEGLGPQAMKDALGLAYSQACGTMQAHVEGSPVLAMQIAFNARNAVMAVDLAAAGLTAPHDVLEGPFGFFNLFEPESDLATALAELGETAQITRVSHKPFPTGRAAHGGLDALSELQRQHAFGADDIESIRLLVPPLIKRLVGRPAKPVMTLSYARLCFGYAAASLLLDGEVSVRCYDGDKLKQPERLSLAARCELVDDGNPDPNAMTPQTLRISLRDGRCYERKLPAVLGSPERPLSRAQHLAKFRRCCADAERPLAQPQVEALIATVDSLEQLTDIRELISLCINAGDAERGHSES